jgi:hypothetical protein
MLFSYAVACCKSTCTQLDEKSNMLVSFRYINEHSFGSPTNSEIIDLIMSTEGWFKIKDVRTNKETHSNREQIYSGTWMIEHKTPTKVVILMHQIREQDLHNYNDGENAAVTRKAEFSLDEMQCPIKAKIPEMFPAKEFLLANDENKELLFR